MRERLTSHKKEIILGLGLAAIIMGIGSKRFLDRRRDQKALRLPYELLLQ